MWKILPCFQSLPRKDQDFYLQQTFQEHEESKKLHRKRKLHDLSLSFDHLAGSRDQRRIKELLMRHINSSNLMTIDVACYVMSERRTPKPKKECKMKRSQC